MTPLELATTDELWKELSKRFNSSVLIYEALGPKGQALFQDLQWTGSWTQALGLTDYARSYMEHYKEQIIDESS
jgi:hypothetical protein